MNVLKNKKTAIIIATVLLLLSIALVLAIILFSDGETPAVAESPAVSPTVSPSPTPAATPSLGKVTGLNLVINPDGLFIIWDELIDADGYRLSISDAKSGETVYEWDCTESMYTFTEYRSDMCCSVTVTAFKTVCGETEYGEPSDAVLSSEIIVTPKPTTTPKPTATPKPTKTPEKNEVSYEIKVNKALNTVTVYKSVNGGELKPYKALICSGGEDTPEGSFKIQNKWRWLWMVDDSYGQWVSQITGNYLFHSVPYWGTKDPEQLDVEEYNKLGTTCSHGCVRLRAGDAKWIYENIPSGTEVIIYSDASDPGPLGKPTVETLPEWHTWDPTDPTVNGKCVEKGCH